MSSGLLQSRPKYWHGQEDGETLNWSYWDAGRIVVSHGGSSPSPPVPPLSPIPLKEWRRAGTLPQWGNVIPPLKVLLLSLSPGEHKRCCNLGGKLTGDATALPDPSHPIATHAIPPLSRSRRKFPPDFIAFAGMWALCGGDALGMCSGHLLCDCLVSIADVVTFREGLLLQLSSYNQIECKCIYG